MVGIIARYPSCTPSSGFSPPDTNREMTGSSTNLLHCKWLASPVVACSDPTEPAASGRVEVFLTDAPVDYSETAENCIAQLQAGDVTGRRRFE